MSATEGHEYAERLRKLQHAWWKRLLPVQLPYMLHLRRLDLGAVLEVGCGVGRNLKNLGGRAVGVDHNPEMVAIARGLGYDAFLPADFHTSEHAVQGRFDSLLISHVVEHMTPDEAREMVGEYLPYLKARGRVVFEAPEEAGFRSDATHVTFFDLEGLRRLATDLGLVAERSYSYPFPRPVGKAFKYNEFVVLARKPS